MSRKPKRAMRGRKPAAAVAQKNGWASPGFSQSAAFPAAIPASALKVPRSWWQDDRFLGLALAVVTLLAYMPAWNGTPVWDDDSHITRPELRSLQGLAHIWIQPGVTEQYYPVVHSFFWLEHRIWGDWPTAYHFVNLLLMIASSLLLVRILRELGIPGAWLAAAIFALHPVQVESVAWITELKNMLSGVFYLGAGFAYLKFDRSRGRSAYAVALVLFVLGLLSKSVIATLPAALLVIFWWKRGKLSWQRDAVPLVPFFGVGVVTGLFTAWMELKFIGAQGSAYNFTVIERFLIAGRAIWFYLGKLVWPTDLIFIYPRWQISQAVWWQYLFPAAALALPAGLWWLRRRWRAPLAGYLFFVGSLFPALGFLNVYPFRYSFVADHFQYLASLGIIVLASAGVTLALQRWQVCRRPAGHLLRPSLLALLAVLTSRQSRMYAGLETLWRTTLARNPGCWLAYNNLGVIEGQRSDETGAIAEFQRSLALNPGYSEAHNNLATALLNQGQISEAIAQYETALQLNPKFGEAHRNLGNTLLRMGRVPQAIEQYEDALESDPRSVPARLSLGNALFQAGRTPEAIEQYERVLSIVPDYAEARNNLGNAFLQNGQDAEAMEQYGAALRLKPSFAPAHVSIGIALAQSRRIPEAIDQFQQALEIDPRDAEAHYSLGNALLQTGRATEAAAEYEQALRINPSYIQARNNIGGILLQAGDAAHALQQFQEILKIAPGYAPTYNNMGIALEQMRRLPEAMEQFKQALRSDPQNADARNNLARLQGLQKTAPIITMAGARAGS